MTCQAAHSDNIKQVMFMPKSSDIVISGSSDKFLKLWRIEDEITQVSQVRLNEAIEKFILVDENLLVVANGNLISLVQIDEAH
jgi:WD40 repeat protein